MQEAPPADPILLDPVKLVVWDLDDTFWNGTLSEESVTAIPANVELVKRLAARGIVSSICSKNDREAVECELTAMGIWDFFVSPSISFQPKGASIAALIDALQLRSASCVFVDDNPAVLAEAGFACPGLVCLNSPAEIAAGSTVRRSAAGTTRSSRAWRNIGQSRTGMTVSKSPA